MRILHFADLHIGVETYGRPLPERGWSSRMQDFLDAYDHLVEYALSEGIDAVIFAGDAYKAREPSQTHQREFARRLRRLSEAGIPTFLLVGNHDLPNAEGRAHALEIYRTLCVPNVHVGDIHGFGGDFRPQLLNTRSGPLQVGYLPWPQVSRLLASDPEAAAMSIEQVHQVVEGKMAALIAEQADRVDPGIPAILTCHVSINDFLVRENPGSEQWMTVGTAPTLLKSALSQSAWDYIALGHHHNNMDLKMDTPCWYAGSMQPVDFGEEGQHKGFMVLDIDPAKAAGSRVYGSGLPRLEAVPAREFVTIAVNPGEDDPTPEVCRAIESVPTADAIVRVTVKLSHEQARLFRVPEAKSLLHGAHFLASFRTELPDDRRSTLPPGHQPDSASPVETLETYLKLKEDLPETRRHKLLAAAQDLIASVDAGHV
ncbi:MAG TPA: exonuclease SbcCD subunit D [Tepidiformaceae bacterium]|nr:exonuclease SbcCD subunit D [Tepidiformaceae bacterium]